MTLLQIKESSKLTNPQTKGNQWQNSKQNSALQAETLLHCLQATLPPANSTTVCALSGSNLMLLEELVSLKTEHKKYTCIFLVCEGILFLFFCCWWILFVLLSSTPLKSPFVKKSSINSSCINMLQFRTYRDCEIRHTACKCVFSRIFYAIKVIFLFTSLGVYNQLSLFAASCSYFCSDPQEMVLQLLKSLFAAIHQQSNRTG